MLRTHICTHIWFAFNFMSSKFSSYIYFSFYLLHFLSIFSPLFSFKWKTSEERLSVYHHQYTQLSAVFYVNSLRIQTLWLV